MDITTAVESHVLHLSVGVDSPLELVLEPAGVVGEGEAETGSS